MLIRIILLVVAYLLLGAHFLRIPNFILTALCLVLPFLLLIKRRWCLIVVQVSLYIGAWIWARSAIIIVHERITHGLPWTRVVMILGSVAVFTLVSGLLLNTRVMKEQYPRRAQRIDNHEHDPEGAE